MVLGLLYAFSSMEWLIPCLKSNPSQKGKRWILQNNEISFGNGDVVHNEDHKRHVDKHCGTCGPFGPISSSGFVQLQIYNIHDPYLGVSTIY